MADFEKEKEKDLKDKENGSPRPSSDVHGNHVEDVGASGHHSDNASSTDGIVTKEKPAVLTRKQKMKKHFRRFWWAYLIAAIILAAILLPILFKVIIPAIVNNIVRGQKMPVNGGALNVISPTRLSMTLNTSLDTPLGVKIEPIDLGLIEAEDHATTPFLTLQIPEEHVHHKTEVIIPTQTVPISNQTQLIAWFNEFFDKPAAKLTVDGGLKIHLGELKYDSHIHKTIEVPGLNYLNGFALVDLQFMMPPDEKGHNMKGHLSIPNAGVLTLNLGNLTFNLMSGDINMGWANLYNLELKPGNNTPAFDGVFYFDTLVPNLSAILDSQKDSLSHGNIALNATGNATFVNGEHIKYIEGVLNQKHIPFTIPVITLLGDVLSGLLSSSNAAQGPLLDIFGDVVGNTTLFGQLLGNWDNIARGGNGTNITSILTPPTKRSKPVGSWKHNLLRLGLRSKLSMK
ncbi:hypothetical protein F5884DRAFT_306845 [Xylogone sp. PMI_703]|nr:hypothetical protein F5884DRAFT_306845 [Xylogone sp. PMI_703]